MFGRVVKRAFISNFYLILGIVLGLCIPSIIDSYLSQCIIKLDATTITSPVNTKNRFPSHLKTTSIKEAAAVKSKVAEKVIRPRYYSTELNIKEKLFVGVLTSEDKINTQAVYINKTVMHVVDKAKFFITVRNKMRTSFNLSGIVGFTDTRHKYRVFQIIKYIGDTFPHDYDYYFLMNDYNYLNVRKLKDVVAKISISLDIYLGTLNKDSSFCDLDAGIVLSNSVIQAMQANLEWCISNAISEDQSENLGRCVYHSINIECQEEIQGQSIPSYKLKHFELEKYLAKLTRRAKFNEVVTVYPILQAKDFYLLNAYFSRIRLEQIKTDIDILSQDLNSSWPAGQRIGANPATRFDLPQQVYFNMTHVFYPDDFTNVRRHSVADLRDVHKIVDAVKTQVAHRRDDLQFRRLVNGYRKFDLSRGMDYILDLGFRDLTTGKEIIKRFEVCKPLGKVEFIPAPYVTENARVVMLLPVEENQVPQALKFMNDYSKTVMERREKALLMLVLLYQYNSSSKGNGDVFATPKQLATKLSAKFRNEDTRVVWVSIRLPPVNETITINKYRALNFGFIDLALKKIGLDSITLVLDVHCEFNIEFLNRVRMNTIANFQIFSPVPFKQYDPKVSGIETFVINKNVGHFDRDEYKYIAFYGKDYVYARKLAQDLVPIVRTDNDIAKIMHCNDGNVFRLFLNFSNNLHCMRATEKDLKVSYHERDHDSNKNLFYGTKVQLAKLLLGVQEKIGFVF